MERENVQVYGGGEELLADIVVKEEYSVEKNTPAVNESTEQFTITYSEDDSDGDDEINIAVRDAILKIREAGNRKIHIKCYICSEKFTSPSILRAHLMRHQVTDKKSKNETTKKISSIPCKYCPNLNLIASAHTLHMQIHHECLKCGEDFANKDLKNKHYLETHKVKCKICKRNFEKDQIEKHITKVHDKIPDFFCLQCNTKFKRKVDLINHMRNKHGQKNEGKKTKLLKDESKDFFCNVCALCFTNIKQYQDHVVAHSHNKLPVKPSKTKSAHKNVWDGATENSSNNELLDDDDDRPLFTCDYCNAVFRDEESYKSHTKTHRYDLHCPYCKSVFDNVVAKEFHMRWNHPYAPILQDENAREEDSDTDDECVQEMSPPHQSNSQNMGIPIKLPIIKSVGTISATVAQPQTTKQSTKQTTKQPPPKRVYIFPKARPDYSDDTDSSDENYKSQLKSLPGLLQKFNKHSKQSQNSTQTINIPIASPAPSTIIREATDLVTIVIDDDDVEEPKPSYSKVEEKVTVRKVTKAPAQPPKPNEPPPKVPKKEMPAIVYRNSTISSYVNSFEHFVTKRDLEWQGHDQNKLKKSTKKEGGIHLLK